MPMMDPLVDPAATVRAALSRQSRHHFIALSPAEADAAEAVLDELMSLRAEAYESWRELQDVREQYAAALA